MELKTFFAQDVQGNIIPNATVYLYLPGTTTPATGLQNESGTALTNPFSANANGKITVAAPDGDYDIKIEGAGRLTTMRVRFVDNVAGAEEATKQADIATAQAGIATDQASVAATQAGIATAQAASATTAKLSAESARDAAQLSAGVYATIAAGIAAVSDGAYFNVPSADAAEHLILYRRVGGAATEIKRYPTYLGIEQMLQTARIQFEEDAEKWFRPAFLTSDFEAIENDGTLEISFSTSATTGVVYYVVLSSGAPTPGRMQIKAGTDGAGSVALEAGAIPVAAYDVAFSASSPVAGGSFDVYVFHERADGATSIRHKASYLAPIVLASSATTGAKGALVSFGTGAVFTENVADVTGALDAVRVTDSNLGTVGLVSVELPVTYANGANRISLKFKKVSGYFDGLQVQTGNVTTAFTNVVLTSTGVISTSGFPTRSTTNLGNGWWKFDAEFDATGWADRAGVLRLTLRLGGSSNITRDGTNVLDVNDVYVYQV
jgi:hypothetical protein